MEENKKYCVWCGTAHGQEDTVCSQCGKKLDAKDRLFVEFLIDHTKDKLKGDLEDGIYEAIKNYLLSHLYSVVVALSLVAVTVTAALNADPAAHIKPVSEVPQQLAVLGDSSGGETAAQDETTAAETTAGTQYYQLTAGDKQAIMQVTTDYVKELDDVFAQAGNELATMMYSVSLIKDYELSAVWHMYKDRTDGQVYRMVPLTESELLFFEETLSTVPRTKDMKALMEAGYPTACMEVEVTLHEVSTQNGERELILMGTQRYLCAYILENGKWVISEHVNLAAREEDGKWIWLE
jgi:hypothetical protein